MDDPSIGDLLEAIRLVQLLKETTAQHEQVLVEIFQRFAGLEQRILDLESGTP